MLSLASVPNIIIAKDKISIIMISLKKKLAAFPLGPCLCFDFLDILSIWLNNLV